MTLADRAGFAEMCRALPDFMLADLIESERLGAIHDGSGVRAECLEIAIEEQEERGELCRL